MFGISDIPKFFLAFFLVLPIISIMHEGGHVFFAWLFGGKNIKVSVGSGKPVFKKGILEIRKYYFWYGVCMFEDLRINNRWTNILIFFGGSLFNLLGVIAVILLVEQEFIGTNMFTYQFTYFSLYYIFFALLPMTYPDGNYSDGRIILEFLRNKDYSFAQKIFRVQWDSEKEEWLVIDHKKEIIEAFRKEEDAKKRALGIARVKRPSRIIKIKDGEEKEIHNYPRIPL